MMVFSDWKIMFIKIHWFVFSANSYWKLFCPQNCAKPWKYNNAKINTASFLKELAFSGGQAELQLVTNQLIPKV